MPQAATAAPFKRATKETSEAGLNRGFGLGVRGKIEIKAADPAELLAGLSTAKAKKRQISRTKPLSIARAGGPSAAANLNTLAGLAAPSSRGISDRRGEKRAANLKGARCRALVSGAGICTIFLGTTNRSI